MDSTTGGHRRSWRRNRRLRPIGIAVRVILLMLIIAVAVSSFIQVPYYALTPGTALNVAPLIKVPSSVAKAHRGSVSLTDVELVSLRAIDYLFYRLNGDDQVEPNAVVRGSASPAQYNEQGVIDMALARQAATVVALHLLGYGTTAADAGVVIYDTEPGSPAAKHLDVAQVITAINGSATSSISALSANLVTKRPGSVVAVTVDQLGGTRSRTVSVALGGVYVGSGGSETCQSPGAPTRLRPLQRGGHDAACLGVTIDQFFVTKGLPFPVTINADGIVGPSAGLAYTLGLMEKLDPADLTGGLKIAATGTMAIDGTVGDVGGVAQKTVAVRRAGATVFFVPPEEYSVAKQHAGSSLRVFSVTSAQQAVVDLEKLGGRLARPTR